MNRMYRLMLLFSVLLIAIIMLSSCCPCKRHKSVNPHTLTSHSWELVELDGNKIEAKEDSLSFTITFEDEKGEYFGKGACNNFFGTYSATPKRTITINGGGATRMMCPNQEREDKFFKELSQIQNYVIDGDMLLMLSNQEVKLIFQAKQKINR